MMGVAEMVPRERVTSTKLSTAAMDIMVRRAAAIDNGALLQRESDNGGQIILIYEENLLRLSVSNCSVKKKCKLKSVISIHTYFVPLDAMACNSMGNIFYRLPLYRIVAREPLHTPQASQLETITASVHTVIAKSRYTNWVKLLLDTQTGFRLVHTLVTRKLDETCLNNVELRNRVSQ
jgi:hypothetical protein